MVTCEGFYGGRHMFGSTIFRVAGFLCVISLSACTSNQVIIDPAGVDMQAYERDRAECQALSQQVQGGQAIKGAAGGAVIGGAIGAIRGNSQQAQRDAGVGAVLGAVGGAHKTAQEKMAVQKNCLRNRGYKVLN